MNNKVTMISDPKDRASVWVTIGSSLTAWFYDGQPLACLYHGSYSVSRNVATTHGAGVRLSRWAEWARNQRGLNKMPEKREVEQENINEEVGTGLFHNLTLIGKPLSDLIAARRLNEEAIKHGEKNLTWRSPEFFENSINHYERLRHGANASDLALRRIEARDTLKACWEEKDKRQAAKEAAQAQPAQSNNLCQKKGFEGTPNCGDRQCEHGCIRAPTGLERQASQEDDDAELNK